MILQRNCHPLPGETPQNVAVSSALQLNLVLLNKLPLETNLHLEENLTRSALSPSKHLDNF